MPNYFLNTLGVCVIGKKCGEGHYPAKESGTCERCHQACNGCTGPYTNNCIECKTNYHKLLDNCIPNKCLQDEYMHGDDEQCKSIYIYIYIYI